LQVVAGQAAVFIRVVGDQADPVNAEVGEDRGTDAVLARVDLQAEGRVRIDGVMARFLQGVSAEFVAEADAASFMARR
jgi:hypothetical protein